MTTRFNFFEYCSLRKQLEMMLGKNFANILQTRENSRTVADDNREDLTFFPAYKENFNVDFNNIPGTIVLNGLLNTDGFVAKGASKFDNKLMKIICNTGQYAGLYLSKYSIWMRMRDANIPICSCHLCLLGQDFPQVIFQ